MHEQQLQIDTLLELLAASPTDEGAWRELYDQMWPFVFSVVFRRLNGDSELAQDASQEVFMRILRASPFKRIPDADGLQAYLWRVADNVGRTYARRAGSRSAIEQLSSDIELRAEIEQAGDELEAEDLARHVLDQLDDHEKELLSLVLAGRSLPEIAKARGLTYSNAGVRVHRLRQKLRNSLFEKEFGDFSSQTVKSNEK